jgi:hypothetical protein
VASRKGSKVILLPWLTYAKNRGDGIHYDTWMSSLNFHNDIDINFSRYATAVIPNDLSEDQVELLPYEVILAWQDQEVENMILDIEESKL